VHFLQFCGSVIEILSDAEETFSLMLYCAGPNSKHRCI